MKQIEKHTEDITQKEMKILGLGKNSFGYVYAQGEKTPIKEINIALNEAGGKPVLEELNILNIQNKGKAKPEYIITFKDNFNTILVIECKNNINKHMTTELNHPKDYAVDGALYYAKYLKKYFNVIAVGISGTEKEKMKVNAYYWAQNQNSFSELIKSKDIILEPLNYLKLVLGEKVQKEYSLSEVIQTSIEIHNALRTVKMTEKLKPLFVAGILLALHDETFSNDFDKFTSFNSLLDASLTAIRNVLDDGEIESEKINQIISKFSEIKNNIKLKTIDLHEDYSLRWYINQLEMKIKPMMNYVGNTIDALGIFYHEFISYSSGDGNSLGIVLTPQHLTEFMCDLIDVNKKSKVLDICCGSSAFLVTAMAKMFKEARSDDEIKSIRHNNLFGVELDDDIHTLALANMIIRKDGKSHIIHGDCFSEDIKEKLSYAKDTNGKNIIFNKGLINPPYSQNDHSELEFLEKELDFLTQGGECAIVCPMSCAIGTKFKDVRNRLMSKHTLKAVFSMPNDIFYGNNVSTNVCVMVWEAWKPHDSTISTFLGYYKDDGFIKKKKLGRLDINNKWEGIKQNWIRLYKEKKVVNGISAIAYLTPNDEWDCEAYMKTDYSKVNYYSFKKTVIDYVAYSIKVGAISSGKINNTTNINVCTTKWKEFVMKDFFNTIDRGKRLIEMDRIPGNIKYFSASKDNNGLTDMISDPLFIEKDSLIYSTFGDCFYIKGEFTASDEISILKYNGMNLYNALFIATIINENKYKYAFGRKAFKNKFENEIIKLPVCYDKKGNIIKDKNKTYSNNGWIPDLQYMENIIKPMFNIK